MTETETQRTSIVLHIERDPVNGGHRRWVSTDGMPVSASWSEQDREHAFAMARHEISRCLDYRHAYTLSAVNEDTGEPLPITEEEL
jgi:hypothetical protein